MSAAKQLIGVVRIAWFFDLLKNDKVQKNEPA